MTQALLWGLLAAGSLLIGQLLATPLGHSARTVGLMMAFGAGTLISAVGYELIPEENLQLGWEVGGAFLLGALVYYAGARIIDPAESRKRIRRSAGAHFNEGAHVSVNVPRRLPASH